MNKIHILAVLAVMGMGMTSAAHKGSKALAPDTQEQTEPTSPIKFVQAKPWDGTVSSGRKRSLSSPPDTGFTIKNPTDAMLTPLAPRTKTPKPQEKAPLAENKGEGQEGQEGQAPSLPPAEKEPAKNKIELTYQPHTPTPAGEPTNDNKNMLQRAWTSLKNLHEALTGEPEMPHHGFY